MNPAESPGDACPSVAGVAESAPWTDLGWAAALGVLFAVSPHTGSARLVPSIVLGGVVAGGVWWYRARLRRREPWARPAPLFTRPTPLVATALVALAVASAPTVGWLYQQYTISIWRNAHGLFVPLIAFLLARSALRRVPGEKPESSTWGFVFVLPGLALLLVDAGVSSGFLSALALVVCLPGVSLLLIGPRRTRAIALPLVLMLFAIPFPVGIIDPLWLVSATANGMDLLVNVLGVPVLRHQTAFQIGGGTLGVSQNCSGVAAFYAATTLSLVLAVHTTSPLRRVVILLTPWLATIAVNSLRGTALLYLCDRFGIQFLHLPVHGLSGIFAFWLIMAVCLLPADRRCLARAFA